MNDAVIINYQVTALMRLVASMFALVGLVPGGAVVDSISADVRRQVLRILQPAESALRRVILVKARGLVVSLGPKRAALKGVIPKRKSAEDRIPAFVLFDPRKWFRELAKPHRPLRGTGSQISGFDEQRFEPPAPHSNEVNPASLCRRLQALQKALETIPAQAKRLARLQAKRRAAGAPLRRNHSSTRRGISSLVSPPLPASSVLGESIRPILRRKAPQRSIVPLTTLRIRPVEKRLAAA